MAGDADYQAWWARRERQGASPSAVFDLMSLNRQINVADILPVVQCPTLVVHRRNDLIVDVEGGRELARLISNAEMLELPGDDHVPWTGDNIDMIANRIEEFLTGTKPSPVMDRVLATALFTDIVDSTRHAAALGDEAWNRLLHRHDTLVETVLERFRGTKIKSTGDGCLATFDGPARAVYAAMALGEAVTELGIEIRAGINTGEIHTNDGDVSGLAVHLAARVMDEAEPGECLVSRTVRDLAAGSELSFEDRGLRSLKGIPEAVRLFRASGK
ncbi:hypothetical protein GCM10017056_49800 [Seohaeicola zhoushanensis]|uniref:Guanylate cyclase domain-containing protein n=2 Tax=Seohaeicola zhoushanensis TaxID=1569283 RepID=A0A8J3MCB7_9RHOB|nr:hypothetical protein GCM10017056_49800 [Seohaeicola zhoushanensis]